MLNLLRMNLYRMFHTKSMLFLVVLSLVTAAFSAYMSSVELEDVQTVVGMVTSEVVEVREAEPADFGIYVETPLPEEGRPAAFLKYFCADLSSGILLIFLTIAAALFINSEEKFGFIKNITGQTKSRWHIYAAKLFVLLGYIVTDMLCYGLGLFSMLKILHGNEMYFGMEILGESLRIIGIQILLYTAFISGIIMLTTICKSTAVSIAVGILVTCSFGIMTISSLFEKLFDMNIKSCMLMNHIRTLTFGASVDTLWTAFAAGVVFTVLYNGIGTGWFVKRDIV